MVQITVSDDLARQIAGAPLPIVLVDSQGRRLGQISRMSAPTVSADAQADAVEDEWSEAKRQMDIFRREGGTFYTTQEVLSHLESLEKE
ncbi:MAG: hypothetical protein AB7G28_23255 [Pirellulales bacterium]